MDNSNDIKQLILERFQAAESSRSEKVSTWNRASQNYRSINRNPKDEYFIPETYTTVETIIPRLVGDFLNTTKPIISVEGRNPDDHKRASSVESLLKYSFERTNLGLKLADFYRQAVIYGSAIGKIFWEYKVSKKKKLHYDIDDLTGRTKYFHREVSYLEKDDPCFETIPLYDFYIDPAATSISNARFCIQKKLLSRREIEDLASMGVYDKDVVSQLPDEGSGEESPSKLNDISITFDSTGSIPKKFKIYEYWEDDRVVVLADDEYILRDEPNPYWHKRKPFVSATFSPLPFEFYGIGIPEAIENLQNILNDIANLRLKNIKMTINRMWLRVPGTVDDKELVSRPGGIISVNNPDIDKALRPLITPDITGSSYKEQSEIFNLIKNTSGTSDYIRGITSAVMPKQTATQIVLMSKQANSRFVFTYKLMAEQSLKAIAKIFLSLLQQYMNTEKTVKVLENKAIEFKKILPIDIQGDYDFIPSIDPLRSAEDKRKESILQFFNLAQEPEISKNINMRKLIEEVANVLGLNPDKILVSQEPSVTEPLDSSEVNKDGIPPEAPPFNGGVDNLFSLD